MAEGDANGRVTTSQFYAAQLETQKMISDVKGELRDMKDEIMAELKPLIVITTNNESRSCNNKDEIEKLRNRSNIFDGINAVVAIIGAAIAAALGRAP